MAGSMHLPILSQHLEALFYEHLRQWGPERLTGPSTTAAAHPLYPVQALSGSSLPVRFFPERRGARVKPPTSASRQSHRLGIFLAASGSLSLDRGGSPNTA